jgi:putative ABC transport system substrate-binding protein
MGYQKPRVIAEVMLTLLPPTTQLPKNNGGDGSTVRRRGSNTEPEDSPSGLRRAQDAAPKLGIKLWTVGFKTRADIPGALETVAKERPDALFVYPDPLTIMEAQQIADFAIKQRLPTMYAYRSFVDAGGMMSYGARDPDMFKLAADQAAKIFKGAAAGDLPVLQATRFELVINLKTAKAVGVTIPPSLLQRADHIIE